MFEIILKTNIQFLFFYQQYLLREMRQTLYKIDIFNLSHLFIKYSL